MRLLAAFLLLAVVARAEDPIEKQLEAFAEACKSTLEPGAQSRIYPVLEVLAGSGDARAVEPLASCVVQTLAQEAEVIEAQQKAQLDIAKSNRRGQVLAKELDLLTLKEKAGDRTVGPAIQKHREELEEQERSLELLRALNVQLSRTATFLRELREKAAAGATTVLAAQRGEQVAAGLAGLRRALDVTKSEQGLFLVRILEATRVAGVEDELVAILGDERAAAPVRRAAVYALASCLGPRGASALLRLWEEDPDGEGIAARHVLALVAHRQLPDLESARAWVATLGE